MKAVITESGRLPYRQSDFRTVDDYLRQWLPDMGLVCKDGFGMGLITGERGAGKSLFGYTVAWWVRRLFGVRITLDHAPRPEFGDFTKFNLPWDLLWERKWMDDIAKRGDEWEGEELKKLKLLKSFVFWDEFYQVAHKRNTMGIMTREFEDIVKQLRHLDSFFLMAMPQKKEVDTTGIDDYVTVDIGASWSLYRPDTANYIVYNRQTMVESPFTIYGPNYYPLYRSKNPIHARKWISPDEYKKWMKTMYGADWKEEQNAIPIYQQETE